MMEKEGRAWLGAFKLCGKNNYVTETLCRNDFLYDLQLEDWDLENLRLNRFFVMTADGNALSLDKLNKFLNLWNKTCVGAINFGNYTRNRSTL